MKRLAQSRSDGTVWRMGPFWLLVRTRDNTAGIELVLGRYFIAYGFLAGKPVFEVAKT